LVEHTSGEGTFAHGNWTEVDESQALFVECPAGTVVLFSANLLHGAGTNTSDRSRYSTAWHYIPANLDLEQFPFGEYKDRHVIC
jgi:ectoine hydroxylase-related dioxygenase (phytanoyl-CoA dioxygenase family)